MAKQIFINLPISDMKASMAFYTALGFKNNPQFSNEQGACLVLGEHVFAMLLTHDFFAGFTPKQISDAHLSTQALIALPCESREKVDELVRLAVIGGASTPKPPTACGSAAGGIARDSADTQWSSSKSRTEAGLAFGDAM